MRAHVRDRGNGVVSVIDRAQEETRIGESDGRREANAIKRGNASFIGAEFHPNHRICFVEHLISIHHEFAAKLKRVIVANPGQACVSRGLPVSQMDLIARPHACRHAGIVGRRDQPAYDRK